MIMSIILMIGWAILGAIVLSSESVTKLDYIWVLAALMMKLLLDCLGA